MKQIIRKYIYINIKFKKYKHQINKTTQNIDKPKTKTYKNSTRLKKNKNYIKTKKKLFKNIQEQDNACQNLTKTYKNKSK